MMIDNNKGSEKARGRRFSRTRDFVRRHSRGARRETASTAVLAGLGTAYLAWENDLVEAMKEAVYQGRHAYRTSKEIVTGGPEGMKAAEKLERKMQHERELELGKALNVVQQASDENVAARENLETYVDNQLALVERMADTYRINETVLREGHRLWVQLNGLAVEVTAVGDKAYNIPVGNKLEDVDNYFINKAGEIIETLSGKEGATAENARESLPQLQDLYRTARGFYDGREEFEDTNHKTLDFLAEREGEAWRQNEVIRNHLESLVGQLDRTIAVENNVFTVQDKVDLIKSIYRSLTFKEQKQVTPDEIKHLVENVASYKGEVDEIRTAIQQDIPIGPYENPTAWVDYAVNPFAVGIVGAVGVKLLARGAGLNRPLTYATLLPYHLVKAAGKWTWKGYKGLREVVRKSREETDKLIKSEGDK